MYEGNKVLDVHGHASPPRPGSALVSQMLMASNGGILPDPFHKSSDAESYGLTEDLWARAVKGHVAYIDARGIDVQVIGPRPFTVMGWMEDHIFPVWTKFVNDSIAKQVSMYPTRFVGACQLPQNIQMPDAQHCVDELNRCVGDLGFVAAYVSPDPTGRRDGPGLAETWWDPLYARCVELNVPIIVHGTNVADRRIRVVPHNFQLGFITEQYLATQVLRHGTVFDRYPELRVIVCHCGGALDRFLPTSQFMPRRDLSANLFFDTCAHDTIYLEAAIRQRGVSQMVFGSEAPGAGAAIRPESGRTADDLVPEIADMSFLTTDQKVQIFNQNVLRVVPGMRAASVMP